MKSAKVNRSMLVWRRFQTAEIQERALRSDRQETRTVAGALHEVRRFDRKIADGTLPLTQKQGPVEAGTPESITVFEECVREHQQFLEQGLELLEEDEVVTLMQFMYKPSEGEDREFVGRYVEAVMANLQYAGLGFIKWLTVWRSLMLLPKEARLAKCLACRKLPLPLMFSGMNEPPAGNYFAAVSEVCRADEKTLSENRAYLEEVMAVYRADTEVKC